MNIGIFGGTFNPIHSGHAMVVNYLSQSGIFDEIWLMISRLNPLKEKCPEISDFRRKKMVSFVADSFSNVRISDFELNSPPPSYTIDTLRKLREIFPNDKFSYIIGSDNWQIFPQWKENENIIKEFGVWVYPRIGYEIGTINDENVKVLTDCPKFEISSSYIRSLISLDKNISYLVPDKVNEYIQSHNLYRK